MIQQALTLAQAALGKANSISAGTTTTVDARVSPLSQSLGVTYDSNNNVTGNQTNYDIADLQARITDLENRLANYENHTHSYDDDNGTTVTTKNTGITQ